MTTNPYVSPATSKPVLVSSASRMKPLSKLFYYGMIVGGFLLSMPPMLFLMFVFAEGRGRDREVVPFLMIPAALPSLLGAIAVFILIYKMWAVIQDGTPRTTPGAAVGLMFIPLFNLFWVFQAYWGWTKDFNQYTIQRGIAAPRMPEGLALTMCIFILLSAIPFIGACFSLINMVLLLIFINSAINGVNALIRSQQAPSAAGI